MAFDPVQEDCLRLILAAMEREGADPASDAAFIERASEAYRLDPATLIHTDRDRSFHLVAMATELADYRAPFAPSEAEAEQLFSQAEDYLREAVELDPRNWDAQRMLATMRSISDDALIDYLIENLPAVEDDLKTLIESAANPYEQEFAHDLGRRAHQRWLAALASRLLIAGRYRMALSYAERALEANPLDLAGARHTGMLALGKLEVEADELRRFRSRHAAAYQDRASSRTGRLGGHRPDAWSLITEMSLAYRTFDFDRATALLQALMRSYPHPAQALYLQAEFPDGVFSRVHVQPGSDDELILALSEATPLLQEGMGTPDAASFAIWVAEHELVQTALTDQDRAMIAQVEGGGPIGGAR